MATPKISVVVATHNRPERLGDLLQGLSTQTVTSDKYEVVVVDDGSEAATRQVLEDHAVRPNLSLRQIRRDSPGGPAVARDDGWRASIGSIVAFTDDDCVPSEDWIERILAAAEREPGAIVQGRTEPMPWERDQMGPFSRTIRVSEYDPAFQTCNILYPRSVLESIDGFDVVGFDRHPGGEDSDLAWRAIKGGAHAVFAPDVVVYHAVANLGPVGRLRVAARWTTPMLAYVRHPELRDAHFVKGIFWKASHYHFTRAALALVVPRSMRWLTPWLVMPYARSLIQRSRVENANPLAALYYVIHDLVEIATVIRAAARYRRIIV